MTERNYKPETILKLLSLVRDLGKRECFADKQLEDAKSMFKWAMAHKIDTVVPSLGDITGADGRPVLLFIDPSWTKTNFIDPLVDCT